MTRLRVNPDHYGRSSFRPFRVMRFLEVRLEQVDVGIPWQAAGEAVDVVETT